MHKRIFCILLDTILVILDLYRIIKKRLKQKWSYHFCKIRLSAECERSCVHEYAVKQNVNMRFT